MFTYIKHLLVTLACGALFCPVAKAGNIPEGPFKAIDSFAINAPSTLLFDTASIAAYLLKGCTTDMEKARAAFTWEANNIRYDDNAFNSGNVPDQSAASVLRRKHGVCEGYANLYRSLCTAMGLEAVCVTGYAKAYGYRAGERFENKNPNHAWNAVKVNGDWLLVDVTWGSGGAEGERGKLVSRKLFKPYWFNVNRYDFVFQHFPADQHWTLLTENITTRQYDEMPLIRDQYFELGFKGSDIFAKYLAKEMPKQFVMIYDTPHKIKVVDLPLDGILSPTASAQFTVESDEDLVMVVSNDLKKQPVMMTKTGNRYSASLPLTRGDLHIAVGKGNRFSDVLVYKVK